MAAGRRPRPAAEAEQFEAGTTLGDIQEKGEIAIGVKFDVPPFGFKNPQTNEVEGFDIDLGKAVADALGVKPKFIEAISDNRIPFLQDGTADLILSTMTINEERVGEIDFSDPYFIAKGRILVSKDNADITGVDDLAGKKRLHGARLHLRGDAQEAGARREAQARRLLLGVPRVAPERQRSTPISTDDVILTGMIIQDDTLQLVGDELTQEPYGAGIKKGDTELLDFVNGRLRGVQVGRPLGRDLREVDRPVHRRGVRAARRSPSTRPSTWSSRTPARSSRACPSPSSTP